MSGEERSRTASPSRRRKAREEGRVAQSRALVACSALLAGCVYLRWGAGPTLSRLRELLEEQLAGAGPRSFGPEGAEAVIGAGIVAVLEVVLPLALVVWVAAALAGLAQTGFLLRPAALAPTLARLSPGRGVRRLASPQAAGRGVLSLLVLALVSVVVGWRLASAAGSGAGVPLGANAGALSAAAGAVGRQVLDLATSVAFGLLALSLLDVLLQRWLLERELRMTPQEALDERKEQEVDREVRGRVERERRRRSTSWSVAAREPLEEVIR